jgi:uncharacterized membrane protein
MGTRPIIKIKKTPLDWCIETVALLVVVAHWLVVLLCYFKLPETIPIHYNGAGEIDGWGSKAILWLLPVISSIMYIGITFVQKIPHLFNYANIEITEKNAEKLYRIAVRMVSILKILVILLFALITVEVLQDALNTFWFMQFWMIWVIMALMGILLVCGIVKMYKAK